MNLIKKINSLIVLALLFTSGLMMFGAGGSQLSVNRDFDASIGLLERPLNTASKLSKFFKPLEANAQGTAQEPTQLLVLAEAKLETAINKAIRAAVLAFVRGLLDFLQDKFKELLNMVEDWAESLLGIRLNLSHVRRFIALKAYTYYNQVEGELNNFFDRELGPIERIDPAAKNQLSQLVSEASEAHVLANAVDEACVGVAAQCSEQRTPATNTGIRTQLAQVAAITAEAQKQNTQNTACGIENPLLAGLCVANDIAPSTQTANQVAMTSAVERKAEEVRQATREALKEENTANNANICGIIIRKNTSKNSGTVGEKSPLNKPATGSKFQNPVVRQALQATSGLTNDALSASECESANQVTANRNALDQINQAKNQTAGEEDLANVLLKVLEDFISQIFDKLKNIIADIIDQALQAVADAIERIGNRIVEGALSKAFEGFSNDFTEIANETFDGLRASLEEKLEPRN